MLGLDPKHLETVRSGMWEVVNGDGTAGASRLQIPGVEMCGKTGTAQVRKIVGSQRGQSGDWKYRDHGLFVFFAPFDKPALRRRRGHRAWHGRSQGGRTGCKGRSDVPLRPPAGAEVR